MRKAVLASGNGISCFVQLFSDASTSVVICINHLFLTFRSVIFHGYFESFAQELNRRRNQLICFVTTCCIVAIWMFATMCIHLA